MIADKMAELGLFGATISPEYGGLGLSAVTYSKIVENLAFGTKPVGMTSLKNCVLQS